MGPSREPLGRLAFSAPVGTSHSCPHMETSTSPLASQKGADLGGRRCGGDGWGRLGVGVQGRGPRREAGSGLGGGGSAGRPDDCLGRVLVAQADRPGGLHVHAPEVPEGPAALGDVEEAGGLEGERGGEGGGGGCPGERPVGEPSRAPPTPPRPHAHCNPSDCPKSKLGKVACFGPKRYVFVTLLTTGGSSMPPALRSAETCKDGHVFQRIPRFTEGPLWLTHVMVSYLFPWKPHHTRRVARAFLYSSQHRTANSRSCRSLPVLLRIWVEGDTDGVVYVEIGGCAGDGSRALEGSRAPRPRHSILHSLYLIHLTSAIGEYSQISSERSTLTEIQKGWIIKWPHYYGIRRRGRRQGGDLFALMAGMEG